MNDQFIKSLRENNDSLEVANIVQRFKVITEKNQMRLLIGCEETPVAGSKLVGRPFKFALYSENYIWYP